MLLSLYIAADDFDGTNQVIVLEINSATTDVTFGIIDDEILEPSEEGFIALMELESAMFPELIDFGDTRAALIRIRDNDGKENALLKIHTSQGYS